MLDTRLASHVAALRATQASPTAADAAQSQLVARLARTTPRPKWRELVVGALASAGVVLLAFGPLFVSRDVIAFSDVQRHFRDFATLVATIDQSVDGVALPRNVVTMTRDGVVRVDVGEQLSLVLDTAEGRGVSLLHGNRVAAPFAFPPGAGNRDELDWLDELRDFAGRAELLPETRQIAGQRARGFALTLAGQRTELWASDEGVPLEMRIDGAGSMQLAFDFAFDTVIDRAQLSLEPPAGYTVAAGED